jgi:polysaccharide export outer membrane protein
MMRCRVLLSLAVTGALIGCASPGPSPLPAGTSAYTVVPERAPQELASDAVGPGDRLAIRVFGEPELTGDNYRVDGTGYLQVPLVGELIVLQQSPRAIAAEIERRLQARFVKNASVSVSVVDRPQATFAVEGDVSLPGIYPAGPNTTLLSALAQARSPTKTALLNDVIVFRQINGQRAGARFDLSAIRRGRAPDPQILAGDTVVVSNSATRTAWSEFLQATPLFNIFYLVK